MTARMLLLLFSIATARIRRKHHLINRVNHDNNIFAAHHDTYDEESSDPLKPKIKGTKSAPARLVSVKPKFKPFFEVAASAKEQLIVASMNAASINNMWTEYVNDNMAPFQIFASDNMRMILEGKDELTKKKKGKTTTTISPVLGKMKTVVDFLPSKPGRGYDEAYGVIKGWTIGKLIFDAYHVNDADGNPVSDKKLPEKFAKLFPLMNMKLQQHNYAPILSQSCRDDLKADTSTGINDKFSEWLGKWYSAIDVKLAAGALPKLKKELTAARVSASYLKGPDLETEVDGVDKPTKWMKYKPSGWSSKQLDSILKTNLKDTINKDATLKSELDKSGAKPYDELVRQLAWVTEILFDRILWDIFWAWGKEKKKPALEKELDKYDDVIKNDKVQLVIELAKQADVTFVQESFYINPGDFGKIQEELKAYKLYFASVKTREYKTLIILSKKAESVLGKDFTVWKPSQQGDTSEDLKKKTITIYDDENDYLFIKSKKFILGSWHASKSKGKTCPEWLSVVKKQKIPFIIGADCNVDARMGDFSSPETIKYMVNPDKDDTKAITVYKERSSFQYQYAKAGALTDSVIDYFFARGFKSEKKGIFSIVAGKKLEKVTKDNKQLIPNQDHLFDHYILASVLTPLTVHEELKKTVAEKKAVKAKADVLKELKENAEKAKAAKKLNFDNVYSPNYDLNEYQHNNAKESDYIPHYIESSDGAIGYILIAILSSAVWCVICFFLGSGVGYCFGDRIRKFV